MPDGEIQTAIFYKIVLTAASHVIHDQDEFGRYMNWLVSLGYSNADDALECATLALQDTEDIDLRFMYIQGQVRSIQDVETRELL